MGVPPRSSSSGGSPSISRAASTIVKIPVRLALVVVDFSLAIFYSAVSLAMSPEQVRQAVQFEKAVQASGTKLRTAGG